MSDLNKWIEGWSKAIKQSAEVKECKEHEYHYYLSTNEDGWRCISGNHKPGEPEGFSPELDRKLIYLKVYGILMDACDANLIYVSNGTGADEVASIVADRCNREGRYDQYSILLYILEEVTPDHAEYWKDISDSIMSGNDKRDRCHCGKLAKMYICDSNGSKHYCGYDCAPSEEAT